MRHVCSEIGEWLYCHDAVHQVYIGIGDAAIRQCGRSRDLYSLVGVERGGGAPVTPIPLG